jgi:hypothetical protein
MHEITPGHIAVFRSLGHRVIGTGNHFVFLSPAYIPGGASNATIYLFKTLEQKQEWIAEKLRSNPKLAAMGDDHLITTTDREFAIMPHADVERRA